MGYSTDNARKLKKVCAARSFTQSYIDERITSYVKKQYGNKSYLYSEPIVRDIAALKKDFSRRLISDTTLIKAFIVLGLTHDEIQKAKKGILK